MNVYAYIILYPAFGHVGLFMLCDFKMIHISVTSKYQTASLFEVCREPIFKITLEVLTCTYNYFVPARQSTNNILASQVLL